MDRSGNVRYGRRWYFPEFQNRRPRLSCQFCSHKQHTAGVNTAWKVNETMKIMGLHKSQSDIGLNSAESSDSIQMLREKTKTYLSQLQYGEKQEEELAFCREQLRMSLATVPKKGLIKLTSEEDDIRPHPLFEPPKLCPSKSQRIPSATQPTPLIKRKDILDNLKEGQKLLNKEKKNVQDDGGEEKDLEEYTVADLQKNLQQLTDNTTQRRYTLHGEMPANNRKFSAGFRKPMRRISEPPMLDVMEKKPAQKLLPSINRISFSTNNPP